MTTQRRVVPTDGPADGPIHDVVGIGVGPFNLGLACLAAPIADLDCVFLEARPELSWHPGMMLDDATLQVPFMADLVTMADPTSPWSFLNYLKQTGALYPFYIRESFYPLRREYDEYCRWAAENVGSVRFGRPVHAVAYDERARCYLVRAETGEIFRGRRLVLGVGTRPRIPAPLRDLVGLSHDADVLHSADYLARKAALQKRDQIVIVGSGQSAAEIYYDLLSESPDHDYRLTWLTRSPRFFPMEYTKLTLELTSPEYTAYFHDLPEATREALLREQRSLYKGISGDLVDAIFDLHYQLRVAGHGPRSTLITNSEVVGARGVVGAGIELDLHHRETHEDFGLTTDGLVLATGYSSQVPTFLDPIRDRLRLDDRGRFDATSSYAVDVTGAGIFVQNGEEHTHGFVAPDLGMGAYRNSVILAAITGREPYPIEKRVAVQSFGVPEHLRRADR
ncbi:lysine N(6)-hydroxylase/L-ornithine N(5)-oxygenase family protein [Nocardioides sp. R-C-SC26]|uniref:lysine N(6)-hydroxylase/L-ornithine N(5)-oxygenase family protein n=1 Tax=Nocardioides sp. R-C-SC26 TaxID=2870414 RepID=UPI001E39F382|nr:SidA/IucD/PvdA family monooxygenase [Nocardioides sp. R-C-SC26]